MGMMLLAAAVILFGAWGALALGYCTAVQGRVRVAALAAWLAVTAAALASMAFGSFVGPAIFGAAALALLAWWSRIRPSNDRPWIPEVARQTHGNVEGDRVTLHNVRNFDWRSATDFDARWETRTYYLSRLCSVDLVLSYWGRPAIAHAMVSFGFTDGQYVVFSVEIRRKQGDAFSEIGGFFRNYELSVIASAEEDSLRVRTNVRGEDGYLYRIHMPREAACSLFLAYVDTANGLVRRPRFYNTLTANCTTLVFQMAQRIVPGLPLDYRLLMSGYLPEYLFELGALQGAPDVAAYRRGGRYTERALETSDAESFSRNIRRGVPGVAQSPA
ncbi:hypothetical protein CDO44_25100 [Pigmentiphaga sp. NML080357]|uniref:Lnb N-terminal periplasmic domain-containing protein n=1 Tax=Pigmentiphaga sp. NML080357 TaxID=2008675 RepID=UPI000B41F299|nr:DUF4105 domain-containing protein [Pigmentiphaga sp. NML080357]OVZ55481.1 hypothetical protein CDO44_25100 [Pigmentiphaga sp. NML080357]